MTRRRLALRVFVTVSLSGVTACARGCTSSRPPIHINPSMYDQPKVLPQTPSDFFYDGASMRVPVPGTIATDGLKEDRTFLTGKDAGGQFVAKVPAAVNERLVARGHDRFHVYCEPCHDARGDGKGILFERGNIPTASLLQEKIVNYPDGQIFDVITNGQGLMPAYRWPIPPADRWAIVSYVRELEQKRVARATAPAVAK